MNFDWVQHWIKLFAVGSEELIGLYSERFEFEDVNMDIQINDDLVALREFHKNFINENPETSYNLFDVFDYVGDEKLGSFQWTWEAKHDGDFLGIPAAGKITKTRGVTVMGWTDEGKINLERSIWDFLPVLKQLDAVNF